VGPKEGGVLSFSVLYPLTVLNLSLTCNGSRSSPNPRFEAGDRTVHEDEKESDLLGRQKRLVEEGYGKVGKENL